MIREKNAPQSTREDGIELLNAKLKDLNRQITKLRFTKHGDDYHMQMNALTSSRRVVAAQLTNLILG